MSQISLQTFEERPVAVVYSPKYFFFAISLSEKLLEKICRVFVVTDEIELWSSHLIHLKDNNFFKIIETSNLSSIKNTDYFFDLSIFSSNENYTEREILQRKLDLLIKVSGKLLARTLVILPFYKKNFPLIKVEEFIDAKTKNFTDVRFLFLGEVFGPRMELSSEGFINYSFYQIVNRGVVPYSKDDFPIYPVFSLDASEEAIKVMFSPGVSKKNLYFANRGLTSHVFSKMLSKKNSSYPYERILDISPFVVEEPGVLTSPQAANFEDRMGVTLDWLFSKKSKPLVQVKEKEIKRISPKTVGRSSKVKFVNKTLVVSLFLGILWFLVLPFVSFLLSGIILSFSFSQITSGELKTIKPFLLTSKNLAYFSRSGFGRFTELPLVGNRFQSGYQISEVMIKATNVGFQSVALKDDFVDLAKKVMSEDEYDIEGISKNIYLNADSLSREIGFLESEVKSSRFLSNLLGEKILKDGDFRKLQSLLVYGKEFVKSLPYILGKGGAKTYLVLFQNNMELRPTGGFIGSFGLVTFENGHFNNFDVMDVYSADGQLKGHVEPPAAINSYLGEANWFLRDSNWDPDFTISASRAEWFLDKELSRTVDGVVGIDLEVAKSLLKITGPLALPDYDYVVDHKNIYERTQYESESNFFPGSRKKANFLTALGRGLMQRVTEISEGKYTELAKAAFVNLEGKHLQLFFHEPNTQRALANLGWDGGVIRPACLGNCYSDYLGIVEANLGVNKVNYFIKRSASFQVGVGEEGVRRVLSLTLENAAPENLGPSGRYKNYIRLVVPPESSFEALQVASASGTKHVQVEETVLKGRKEAGILVDISPKTKQTITFTWSTIENIKLETSGEYSLYWRKQAGVGDDPIATRFYFPKEFKLTPSVNDLIEPLTDEGLVGYNTSLRRDLLFKIKWTK